MPTPTPAAANTTAHANTKGDRRRAHRRRANCRGACPAPSRSMSLTSNPSGGSTPGTTSSNESAASESCSISAWQLGHAPTWASASRALSSRRDPERELRDLLSVLNTFRPGAHVVTAHRRLPSLVIVSRSLLRPTRIRVFAVPSGIVSASLISAAVIP